MVRYGRTCRRSAGLRGICGISVGETPPPHLGCASVCATDPRESKIEPTEPSATAQDISKWENWTTFLAQLTARSTGEGSDPFDFSLYALWALRDALEKEEKEGRPASKPAVRLASLWVRHAGERLRKLSADSRTLEGNMGSSAGKYSQRGWKGFNEERWKAWTEELKEAQATLGSDETIEGAVKRMEEL